MQLGAKAQKNAHTPYRNSVLTHFLQVRLWADVSKQIFQLGKQVIIYNII